LDLRFKERDTLRWVHLGRGKAATEKKDFNTEVTEFLQTSQSLCRAFCSATSNVLLCPVPDGTGLCALCVESILREQKEVWDLVSQVVLKRGTRGLQRLA